jgi:hypothetical protein
MYYSSTCGLLQPIHSVTYNKTNKSSWLTVLLLVCECNELLPSMSYLLWNKEESPGKWKCSSIVPIYKKGYKTDCGNYHGISLLSNFLLSRLSPYIDKITGDHQYGFLHNRSTTDQIFLHLSDNGGKIVIQ